MHNEGPLLARQGDVRVDTVPDPKIEDPRDAIVGSPPPPSAVRICISTTAIMPTMEKGDVLGHEPMGEVVEVGRASH